MLSSKKILIIDDDEDIVDLIQDVVSFDFEPADTAFTADNGLKLIDQNAYDCIVLDLNIQNINGAVVIKHIQDNPSSANHETPIIIISGYVDDAFSEKYTERFFGIVPKPFEVKQLISLIKTATKYEVNIPKDTPIKVDTPFVMPDLKIKVEAALEKVKVNKTLEALFKDLKISRDKNNYIKIHTGLSINIATAMAKELHWGSDTTYDKIIYAAYLKDMALIDRPDLIRIHDVLVISKSPDAEIIIAHPTKAAEMCEDYALIPDDVTAMVAQHHETSDGSGFPNSLNHQRITPLATLFIIANDLADYIIDNTNWSLPKYLKKAGKKYSGTNFRKVLKALADTKR